MNRRPPRPKRGALPTAPHPENQDYSGSSIIFLSSIVKDTRSGLTREMVSNLIRIHHADYQEDLPFWIRQTEGLDPVLEVGCGHGRVTLPLAEAGRVMVGVDSDSDSLDYLRSILEGMSAEIRLRVSLIDTDILDFQPETIFGGVIIPCNTYSTFNVNDRLLLIQKAHTCLKKRGILIISLPNPQGMKEFLTMSRGKDQIEDPDLEDMITHPRTGFPVQVSSRLRTTGESLLWDWIYDHLHPNGLVERAIVTVEHFPTSWEETLAELRRGGFEDVLCQGDFSGGQFHELSPYLILICRK